MLSISKTMWVIRTEKAPFFQMSSILHKQALSNITKLHSWLTCHLLSQCSKQRIWTGNVSYSYNTEASPTWPVTFAFSWACRNIPFSITWEFLQSNKWGLYLKKRDQVRLGWRLEFNIQLSGKFLRFDLCILRTRERQTLLVYTYFKAETTCNSWL